MVDLPAANIDLLLPLLAGAVALAFSYLVFQKGGKQYLGAEFSMWNPLRRALIPVLDAHLGNHFDNIETNVYEEEYVCTVYNKEQAELDRWFAEDGAMRYPLSSIATTADGRTETASWAYHDHPFAKRQLHSRTYDAHPTRQVDEMQAFDIYAHDEYSAHNVFTALKHYNGDGMDKEAGVEAMREKISDAGLDHDIIYLE